VDGQREYLEDDLPWGCHRAEAGESWRIAVEERDGGWERRRERRVMKGERGEREGWTEAKEREGEFSVKKATESFECRMKYGDLVRKLAEHGLWRLWTNCTTSSS
jgi:hypothetical protein